MLFVLSSNDRCHSAEQLQIQFTDFGQIICDNSRILVADLVLLILHCFETYHFAAFFVIGLFFFLCIDNYIYIYFKDPYLCSDLKNHVICFFSKDDGNIITGDWFYRTCLIDVYLKSVNMLSCLIKTKP